MRGVAWGKLETHFNQGEYIRMKPVRGPGLRCLLEEVSYLCSFTTKNTLPFTTVRFTHQYKAGVVTHRVSMNGLLTPLFRRLFGNDMQQGLPQAVRTLVAMAEANT